jgi:adenylate cyclase
VDREAERRLAAIMFTDVVGYTTVMAESEDRGLRARHRHRALVRPLVEQYRGQPIEARGDESLSVFPNTLDAVNCGLAILARLEAEPELELHVGIHLGDVVVREGEISGDGVNIASRICALSEGGRLCVSEEVFQSVRNHPHLDSELLGVRELKGVGRPVTVYALGGSPAPPSAAPHPRRRLRPFLSSAAVLLILLGVGGWLSWPAPLGLLLDLTGLGESPAAPALPVEPSIVVLPFANLSDGGDQAYFADGVAEDLMTDLSGIPGLFVISRNSAFAYRGEDIDVLKIGRELGVRYVAEGSVRRAADQVRVTARLSDAASGFQLWSARYDRELSDVFALQSEISEEILAALNFRILEAEVARLRRKPTDSLSAYEALKRGNAQFGRFTREGHREARLLFERALELDPEYADAYAALANVYNYEYMGGWNQDPALLDRAEELVRRSLELDDAGPAGHAAKTAIDIARSRWRAAVEAGERAIELAPSFDFAHLLLAMAYRGDGRLVDAFQMIRRGMRLDPRGQAPTLSFQADLNYRAGRTGTALEIWQQIRLANPDAIAPRVALADHYETVGQHDEALALLREVLRINPDYSVELARGPGGRSLSEEGVLELEAGLRALREARARGD